MIASNFVNAIIAAHGTDLMEEVIGIYGEHVRALNQIGPLFFILFKDNSAVIDDNGGMTILEHYSFAFEAINEWLLTHPEHRSIFEAYGNV